MSKLAEQVTATVLNRKRYTPKLFKFTLEEIKPPLYAIHSTDSLVRFEARLGMQVYLQDDLIASGYKEEVLKNITHSVVEEVFGEFRAPIRELMHDVMSEEDRFKTMEKLEALYKQMFNV